ncbi:uncharacterized protein LOC143258547 [Tachypleus tridentatus]|uniref:uncharacterized protein LOC143258547 n=1 Tax=Tachypleus tridentatus TaxID=6853 RepID=UPI003FD3D8FB
MIVYHAVVFLVFVFIYIPFYQVMAGLLRIPPEKEVEELDQVTSLSYLSEVKAPYLKDEKKSVQRFQPTSKFEFQEKEKQEMNSNYLSKISGSSEILLKELMSHNHENTTTHGRNYKLGYSIDDGQFKKFRYEEKTPDGLIVGEFGFHHDNGIIRGVRYTAEAGVHPKILYESLVKFLSL